MSAPMGDGLRRAGFQCYGSSWVDSSGIAVTLDQHGVVVEVSVEGIDDSTVASFVALTLEQLAPAERPSAFATQLLEWAGAQRQQQAPGLVLAAGERPRYLRDVELPSAAALGADPARQLRIFTWGLRVIPAGQLPKGAEDSEKTYDASVLTARKHGVTGRSALVKMNGLDPVLQAVLCKDYLFPGFLRDAVADIEAQQRRAVSVVCAHGQHRSVAAAEIMKALYYPRAELVHLTIRAQPLSAQVKPGRATGKRRGGAS
eukprot:g1259.t1